MEDAVSLDRLLRQRPDIWRASTGQDSASRRCLSSGSRELDRQLGGGWPRAALVELLLDQTGIGEVSLLLPCLSALTVSGRTVAMVSPPHIPHARALQAAGLDLRHLLVVQTDEPREALWAFEQILRDGSVAAALYWAGSLGRTQLRRLQLAAEQGDAIGFVYRSSKHAGETTPVAMKLLLMPGERTRPHVRILKCRGMPVSVRNPETPSGGSGTDAS